MTVVVDLVRLLYDGVSLVVVGHEVVGLQADRRRHGVRAVQRVRRLGAAVASAVVVRVMVVVLGRVRHVSLTLTVRMHVWMHVMMGVSVVGRVLSLVVALVAVVLLGARLVHIVCAVMMVQVVSLCVRMRRRFFAVTSIVMVFRRDVLLRHVLLLRQTLRDRLW